MKKNVFTVMAALGLLAYLLGACGPEPGKEAGENPLFAQEEASSGQAETGPDVPAPEAETAEYGETAAAGADAGKQSQLPEAGAGGTAAVAEATGAAAAEETAQASPAGAADPEYARPAPLDSRTLEELEAFLNEDSSYGFLLSCYERPEDIDLAQVFYDGAGAPRENLEEREKSLLLDRLSMDFFPTSVTKVREDYIEDLLLRRAGISYEASNHPLDTWSHIGRYRAYYHLHGDTNRVGIRCTDGWQQGDTYILHYRLGAADLPQAQAPETSAAGSTAEVGSIAEEGTAGTDTAAPAFAGETDAGPDAAGQVPAAGLSTGAGSDAEPLPPQDACYRPTYEVELKKTGQDYRFCSNILWVQKDLIEAQSYQADLAPLGEVFFAPVFPDTDADPRADVSFALVKGRSLLMTLGEMEAGNIRSDRFFTGVDAVDFTDYNGDGYTDILTVCSYQLADENGNRTDTVREARVYTMQVPEEEGEAQEGWPLLDRERTGAVNRDVQTLNITNVTEYLTGKSDGQDKTYGSWKEAFADHLRGLNEDEYRGFALISLTEGRTPVFVQVGATPAKGATLVVYRNGRLEETWLNRNTFRYLEYENVLYSSSGIENLHYDTIYSIVLGRLQISVQGYYGNSRVARLQRDRNGREIYDYFWDGGAVSQNGYRDGLAFVFDASRAKECGADGLLTREEMLGELE